MSLLLLASAAFAAAPDLTTTITAPTSTPYVYQSARWTVRVNNSGNKDATSVVLTIQLPKTNTSPSVYVMGTLGAKSAACTLSGTKLSCNLGTLKRSTSNSVYFDIALPESSGALTFSATASTTLAESNTANNASSSTASPLNYSPTVTGPRVMVNRHCTGTSLTSFYDCEVSSGSISSHEVTFNSDGSISIAGAPDYGGTWSVNGTELVFEYTELGVPVADFVGYGVDSLCWEGITVFPGSAYVAPYEVCPQ